MVITDSIFSENLKQFFPFEQNPEVAVAVSGGADSMCLALLLNSYFSKQGGSVKALIVDHGLREESAQEASTVKKRLNSLGINATILKLNLNKNLNSVQQRARQARYDKILDYCKENNILHLFVGHHFNDQQETISMRLKRGEGFIGFTGINSTLYKDNVRILRPMLKFSKQDIYNTLTNRYKADWVEDPSNKNTKFERVRVRNFLQENNSNIDINELNAKRKSFEKSVLNNLENLDILLNEFGVISFCKQSFLAIKDNKVKLFLISRLVSAFSAKEHSPALPSLSKVLSAIVGNKSITLNGFLIYTLNNFIVIHREFRNMPQEICTYGLKNSFVWDNRFKIQLKESAFNNHFTLKALGKDGFLQLKQSKNLGKLNTLKGFNNSVLYTMPYIFDKNNMVILNNQDYINSIEVFVNKCGLLKDIF